jgi:hypothetical protein
MRLSVSVVRLKSRLLCTVWSPVIGHGGGVGDLPFLAVNDVPLPPPPLDCTRSVLPL